MKTKSLTTAQALITFLKNQSVECDGNASPFFAGVWGIFGHGNLAGIGQALQQTPDFRFYLARNEQAMVHTATAYAKMKNRLSTFACTSSVGPGATNMITGAATATINRLPVLLLPGDIFARRNVAPVLQQLESSHTQDISVNDAFKPVSRYWDRINRPDQLPSALMEAMRVLTSRADTGAVTLALPQDVQAEAWNYPVELFEPRTWHISRPMADRTLLARAVEWIQAAQKPLIIAGGGVIYSEASAALALLVKQTGIPVGETMAGKGALPWDDPQNLQALGATGTPGANFAAREADLVIAVGTRLSDFTTASKTAFQNPEVRFININVAEFDAYKHAALPLVTDARVTLDELRAALEGYRVDDQYTSRIASFKDQWRTEVERLFNLGQGPPISQGEVIGIVNGFSRPEDVVVCAAGSLPGDLHKLWRTHDPKGYHLEYGNSCMGYEIAGGLGVKLADPSREVYVMVGDGSYLMMSSEIVTAIQEGVKLNIILLNNYGFSSIGGLSKALGSGGFGTDYRARRPESGQLDGGRLEVDFAANAESLGAHVIRAVTREDLQHALAEARAQQQTTVIVIEVDKEVRVPGYESWWDVPVAEVSEIESVKSARETYDEAVKRERFFL
ncbi:MAG TPA: 3D-(3,5/4)-trihydroxycyclohexane-1,2-dione acylhydrolase (decyclizing) [Pyrinomonadaceae bacterium]